MYEVIEGPITALQRLDCYWSVDNFIEVLTRNNQNFWNDFLCIHYHLCKISAQIIEWKLFAPNDFHAMNYITIYYRVIPNLNITMSRLQFRDPTKVTERAQAQQPSKKSHRHNRWAYSPVWKQAPCTGGTITVLKHCTAALHTPWVAE